MKKLLILGLLLWPLFLVAQHTNVVGTVQDPFGVVYANCTGNASFIGQNTTPGAGPYTLNGSSFQTSTGFNCTSSGTINFSLADNLQITPTPSQWNFSICTPQNAYPIQYCFNALITITGATQNITIPLQASAVTLPTTAGTASGSKGQIQIKGATGTFSGVSPVYADVQAGADCGAKVQSADTFLGGNAGEIWVTQLCGAFTTPVVTLNPSHLVKIKQGGLYSYCTEFILKTNAGFSGPASGPVENITTEPLPPVLFQQSPNCNLPVSFLVSGANVVFENFHVSGNNSSNHAINGVGIGFDTVNNTANGSLGHVLMKNVTIAEFAGDNIQVVSTGINDQAVGFKMEYVVSELSLNGQCLTIINTTDVKLNKFFGESCGGYGFRNVNSLIWMDTSDLSQNNAGGIYETGTSIPSAQLQAGLYITSTSFDEASLTGSANPSLNGAIVIQGWDGSTCGNASIHMGPGNSFGTPAGSQDNAWDYIRIENSGGNTIDGALLLGPAGPPRPRYGYSHANTQGCATLPPDILISNQFVGTFGTAPNLPLAADMMGLNIETANSGFTQWRMVNALLPNGVALNCGNAAFAPKPCLATDGSNNTIISGDPSAGQILLQAHGGSTDVQVQHGGISLNAQPNVWTSGAGAPGGACAVGSVYTNSTASNASTVLYVCGTTNTWTAVGVP